MNQPTDYNLPHGDWRNHQQSTIEYCLSTDGTSVIASPTGSGKTSFAAATASQKSVIALCRTKNLQAENYGKTYGFDILYGKSNYPCVHPDAPRDATCADCLHEDNMYQCGMAKSCEYLQQKRLCIASPKVSLNYAYWLTAVTFRENPPQVLFLDEAHEVASTVTAFCGCTITERDRVEWGLASFPELKPKGDGGMLTKVSDPLPIAVSWLNDARVVLRREWRSLKHAMKGDQLKRKRKCERLSHKISNVIGALKRCPDDWYIKSGQRAQKFKREYRPAFVCKPLTARHHAPGYFLNGHNTIMMSATIGKPDTFAAELGVGEFDFLEIPHQYPVESRQVYVLDVPSMGSRASDSAFEKQADEIAQAVLNCPKEWPGIIHVTRKRESGLLADRLARRGLGDRVWVPPGADEGTYEPTDKQVAAWKYRKSRVPNSLAISWSMWTGYDGLDERICIAAKVPFPLWGSAGSYAAMWRAYSMERYRWEASNMLAQGLGRTRRGRAQDYDLDGGFEGFCAIADNSYRQVRKALPGDLLESLVE
jgi:Rad3-related DNA helicase